MKCTLFGAFSEIFQIRKPLQDNDLRICWSSVYFAHHDVETAHDRRNVSNQTAPAELTTQKRETNPEEPIIEPVVEKLLTKVAVSKMPTFTGTGPFKFTLGLSEQASSTAIKDPDIAIGLKVFSQTPTVCRVASTFNSATGKYAITVVGISNGQCRITAIDKGSDEKFPTATEIKQTIKGIAVKKTVNTKAVKPKPTPKPGTKNATYKQSKG